MYCLLDHSLYSANGSRSKANAAVDNRLPCWLRAYILACKVSHPNESSDPGVGHFTNAFHVLVLPWIIEEHFQRASSVAEKQHNRALWRTTSASEKVFEAFHCQPKCFILVFS